MVMGSGAVMERIGAPGSALFDSAVLVPESVSNCFQLNSTSSAVRFLPLVGGRASYFIPGRSFIVIVRPSGATSQLVAASPSMMPVGRSCRVPALYLSSRLSEKLASGGTYEAGLVMGSWLG